MPYLPLNSPTIVGGSLYCQMDTGLLYCFDETTKMWVVVSSADCSRQGMLFV